MDPDRLAEQLVNSAVFAIVGLVVFGLAFFVMIKVAPFSLRKEIEEDQNVALGLIMAAVLLGVAIIVAAAIHG